MNEEVKQTVLKVADYAEVQKEKLLKNMRFFSIAELISMMIEGTSLVNNQIFDNIGSFAFGLAFASIILNVLYTTGNMLKVKQSDHQVIIKGIVIVIAILFVLLAIKVLG